MCNQNSWDGHQPHTVIYMAPNYISVLGLLDWDYVKKMYETES